jgi:hypothetical protein
LTSWFKKEAKVLRIWERIGKRPVLGVGNSSGDLQMLRFVDAAEHRTLMLVVDHDGGARENLYGKGS